MFKDARQAGPSSNDKALPGEPSLSECWAVALRRLRAQFGEDIYLSWISKLELQGGDGDAAILTAPTRFLKSWVLAHYADRIVSELARQKPGIKRIAINIRSVNQNVATRSHSCNVAPAAKAGKNGMAAPPTRAPLIIEQRPSQSNGVDPKMNFANFIVGPSNALAHAAATRVAAATTPPPNCNPLYVHAGVGLGKTHLLQAIGNEAERLGRRVLYLTADTFMYGFASSARNQNVLSFKDKVRSIDLLLTDDAQFLQGKMLQQEFGHTLSALIDAGKAVVVAADRPPSELESLDERVRSRLKGGLVVDIEAHDEEMRRRILMGRIEAARQSNPGFDLSEDVVNHIARRITKNGRDLDGALNRLIAHVSLTGQPVTIETADAAIRDLVGQREPRRPKIEEIQKLVASHFNVSRADILSARRTANVVKPRQIAMYLSKILTPRSLPEIGRRFGGRDHTTVLHAVRKVGGLVEKDGDLRDTVDLLRRILTE